MQLPNGPDSEGFRQFLQMLERIGYRLDISIPQEIVHDCDEGSGQILSLLFGGLEQGQLDRKLHEDDVKRLR